MRVLIVHFRSAPRSGLQQQLANVDPLDSAGTDGVSLEIAKRQKLLEAMGHKVAVCSAYEWADFAVPALEFDREGVTGMVRNLFGPSMVDFASEGELRSSFDVARLDLQRQLGKVVGDFNPNVLFVHNVLSLPIHPAATVGLADLLREKQLPCAAIHHDIQSEGAYKFTPTCNFARSIIEEYYPPTMPNLRHWTINTRSRTALRERGVDAEVIYDTMDFDQRLGGRERARIRSRLRAKYGIEAHDVVLFAGARIVPNKQTELAGRLTAVLQSLRHHMIGKKLYHGGVFSEKSRVVLVIAGRPERAFAEYRDRLFKLFDSLKIDWRYAGDDVRPYRMEEEGLYALYPDFYAIADFVLYPTRWEGFGNQLIEAFAAQLPVAIFEYPVFKEDIAPKGVEVVSLGQKPILKGGSAGLAELAPEVLTCTALEIMAILTSHEKFGSITEHNITVGKKYFGFDVLRAHLQDVVEWSGSVYS